MEKFRLNRTKQCAKCPFKVSTNPYDIPHGYNVEKHKNLANTIAIGGNINFKDVLPVMACHHSETDNEDYCIGWLNQQLGTGNKLK